MINLKNIAKIILTSSVCIYAGISLVANDLNPVHWKDSFKNQNAIRTAQVRGLEKPAEENSELCNQVLRKAEMYDDIFGLSWRDAAKLCQDLGVEKVICEGSQIGFQYPYEALKILITDPSRANTEKYVIPKEKLLEYLAK